MRWIRGNLSILFAPQASGADASLLILDHEKKTVEYAMRSLAHYSKSDADKDISDGEFMYFVFCFWLWSFESGFSFGLVSWFFVFVFRFGSGFAFYTQYRSF